MAAQIPDQKRDAPAIKTRTELWRAAREAYFAWQSAPAGAGSAALDAYIAANRALAARDAL